MITGLPFDDIRGLVRQMPSGDEAAAERTRATLIEARQHDGELDRLEAIAVWLSRWSGKAPTVRRPLVAIFAGTHGVAVHGISRRPASDTASRVTSCAAGTAALNRICAIHDLGLQVYDLALDMPTGDMSREAALDEKSCAATMAFGMEAVAGGVDLLCIGAFGVGDETVAAAMLAALHGGPAEDWIDGEAVDAPTARRIAVVDRALALHAGHLNDPLEVLRRLGGRQFAALAGAIVAARMQKVPVILDGIAAIAAASVLHAMRSDAVEHCLLAQSLAGRAFSKAQSALRLVTAFDPTFSSEDGIVAALTAGLVKGAAGLAPPAPIQRATLPN